MKTSTAGIIYAMITVLLWSTLGVSLKISVTNIDGFSVAVYVGLFATVALFINLRLRGKQTGLGAMFRRHPWFLIGAGVLGLGIQQITYLTAFEHLPASEVVILLYLYPLWMPLIARFLLKEHISLLSVLLLGTGFLGVALLVSRGSHGTIEWNPGILLAVMASISWGLFSVLLKTRSFDVEQAMFFFCLFGFLFLLLFVPFFGLRPWPNFQTLAGLVYLAVFPTAIAFVTWNNALHRARTTTCSNIALLTPLLSFGWIAVILSERLTAIQWLGAGMILGSVFLSLNITRHIQPQPNGHTID